MAKTENRGTQPVRKENKGRNDDGNDDAQRDAFELQIARGFQKLQ